MKIESKKKVEKSNEWLKNNEKEKHNNKEYVHSEIEQRVEVKEGKVKSIAVKVVMKKVKIVKEGIKI